MFLKCIIKHIKRYHTCLWFLDISQYLPPLAPKLPSPGPTQDLAGLPIQPQPRGKLPQDTKHLYEIYFEAQMISKSLCLVVLCASLCTSVRFNAFLWLTQFLWVQGLEPEALVNPTTTTCDPGLDPRWPVLDELQCSVSRLRANQRWIACSVGPINRNGIVICFFSIAFAFYIMYHFLRFFVKVSTLNSALNISRFFVEIWCASLSFWQKLGYSQVGRLQWQLSSLAWNSLNKGLAQIWK